MRGQLSKALTPRETQTLELILEGHSTESAAAVLELSKESVKLHTKRLFAKRGVNSRLDLAVTELRKRHADEMDTLRREYGVINTQPH